MRHSTYAHGCPCLPLAGKMLGKGGNDLMSAAVANYCSVTLSGPRGRQKRKGVSAKLVVPESLPLLPSMAASFAEFAKQNKHHRPFPSLLSRKEGKRPPKEKLAKIACVVAKKLCHNCDCRQSTYFASFFMGIREIFWHLNSDPLANIKGYK